MNVLATLRGKPYLIGVVKMEACNHSTFSQAIISSVSEVGITFHNVISVVSDSAAYCKKAFKDVLSAVYPKSVHVVSGTYCKSVRRSFSPPQRLHKPYCYD